MFQGLLLIFPGMAMAGSPQISVQIYRTDTCRNDVGAGLTIQASRFISSIQWSRSLCLYPGTDPNPFLRSLDQSGDDLQYIPGRL
jgi:hypothetical protein